jgi:hypothetical protein
MVAITKSIFLLLGAAIACAAAAAPAPTPEYSPMEMSQVIDCQTQCVKFTPPFGHAPDIEAKTYMKVKDYGRINYLYKNMRTHIKVQYMFGSLSLTLSLSLHLSRIFIPT